MSRGSMRDAMPTVAAWIDDLRDAFGAELIDGQIRKAIRDGLPTFHAVENGHEVGVQAPQVRGITADKLVLISSEERSRADRNNRR